MRNLHFTGPIVMIGLGFSFLFLENYYFQYVNENGVLNESYFLPLGVISVLCGIGLLLLSIFRAIIKNMKKSGN